MIRSPDRPPPLARRPAFVSWAALATIASPLIVVLELMGFPAAVMVASIAVAVSGGRRACIAARSLWRQA